MRIGVFGNLTLDELEQKGERIIRPGGSALYSSMAAAHLGAKVSVVSNVGDDYPRNILFWMRQHGIDTSGIKRFDGSTTRFKISYRRDSRELVLIHPGRRLAPNSARGSLQAIHLGPVFMEVGLDALNYARRRSEFLSLDVQGLLRAVGRKGVVRLVRRRVDPFLSRCNLVKATETEARVIAPGRTIISTARRLLQKGAEYAIITRGQSGSLLVKKGSGAIHIPSVQEKKVADMTGAGDIFVGSWLATFLSVGDALWAGAVGSAFASISVRRVGALKFRFAREELFQRASWVYNNSRIVKG